MKGEYFMSNGAKFRLQQLQGYFEWLIIVTLIQLSVKDFEHKAITGSRISTKLSQSNTILNTSEQIFLTDEGYTTIR